MLKNFSAVAYSTKKVFQKWHFLSAVGYKAKDSLML
jgi:hypothetical protein